MYFAAIGTSTKPILLVCSVRYVRKRIFDHSAVKTEKASKKLPLVVAAKKFIDRLGKHRNVWESIKFSVLVEVPVNASTLSMKSVREVVTPILIHRIASDQVDDIINGNKNWFQILSHKQVPIDYKMAHTVFTIF